MMVPVLAEVFFGLVMAFYPWSLPPSFGADGRGPSHHVEDPREP